MRRNWVILTFALFLIAITGIVIAENNSEEDDPIPTLYATNDLENETVFCTMDAKMCPDGSYVGRDPENNCQFHACSKDEDDDKPLLGASCGTVTPGYQNECCERKGFDRWDAEEFTCIKESEEEGEEQEELVGRSCGTVTPGMENECCKRKGYYGWDSQEFKCADKTDLEEDKECENWNCTRWNECSSEGIRTRECVASGMNCTKEDDEDENETEEVEQPRLTRPCYENKQLRPHEGEIECPEECACSGSTIKCTFENGTRVMTVYAGNSGNIIVQIKNLNMSTNVTLYKGENGKIYGVFNENKTKEIHMPDEVREKLQNHTRTRLHNESINLTEEGYYKIEGKKKARLFWIIPVKEHVRAEVNAETGEEIKIRNPWWGFLARDIKEDNSED